MQGCLWFLQSAKVQREAESSAIKLLSLLPPVATLSARKLYEQMVVMPAPTISGETLMVLLSLVMFLPKYLFLLSQTLLEIVPRSTKALQHPQTLKLHLKLQSLA